MFLFLAFRESDLIISVHPLKIS